MKRVVASLALLSAALFAAWPGATAAEPPARLPGGSPGLPGEAPGPDQQLPRAPTAAGGAPEAYLPGPAADTSLATLRGRVRSEQTGLPLPHVFVEAVSGALRHTAVTDGDGRYRLTAVPPGRWTVRAYALDHALLSVDVEVAPGGEVALDLALRLRPVGLPPITAAVGREADIGDEAAGGQAGPEGAERESELRALEATPGMAELGLAEAAGPRTGPDPVDPTSVLYVRGAASDLKLVLLDGTPVFAPFHLAGLIEAFQPEVLASSRLFLGGAPARYDGGLSYILDLRTRPGDQDRIRASGAADFLSVRQRVEGPVGPGRFLVSGRGIHGSTLHEAVSGAPLPYRYGDALARLDLPAGEAHRVSATAFWNREAVRLDSVPLVDQPARWGNTAGSLRYRGGAGAGDLELTAAVGLFQARLPLASDSLRLAEGESRRLRLGADYALPAGDRLRLAFGTSYDLSLLEFRARTDGGEERGPNGGTGRGESVGGYADAVWSPADVLELRAGLRAEAFATAGRAALAPRVRATWRLAEDASLFVAVGRFHQYVRAPETILGGDLDGFGAGGFEELVEAGAEAGAGGRLPLGVARASHLVVGLRDELSPGLRLGLEGFLKVFDEVPGAADLRASGVDLWVHRGRGDWRGWLGYSLAFVWSQETREASTSRFAGRQILSAGLEAELLTGLALDLRLAYGAGLPFTSIPLDSQGAPVLDTAADLEVEPRSELPLAGAPPGSYLRVDGKLSRPWAARVGGVDLRLVPYVKVLNALNRRDALFFQFDPRQDLRPRSLAAIPVVPLVGIEWTL